MPIEYLVEVDCKESTKFNGIAMLENKVPLFGSVFVVSVIENGDIKGEIETFLTRRTMLEWLKANHPDAKVFTSFTHVNCTCQPPSQDSSSQEEKTLSPCHGDSSPSGQATSAPQDSTESVTAE